MTIALVLFAVGAVLSAGTLAVDQRNLRAGHSVLPTWWVWLNLALTLVTAVLVVLVPSA